MSRYSMKGINFDVKRDIQKVDARTYGFLKTKGSDTPMPTAAKRINQSTLIERLKSITLAEVVDDEDQSSTGSVESGSMSFEMKRKLFDAAEFTITRGQKLSDLTHAADEGINFSPYDTGNKTLEEIEEYCRAVNIKFAK